MSWGILKRYFSIYIRYLSFVKRGGFNVLANTKVQEVEVDSVRDTDDLILNRGPDDTLDRQLVIFVR